MNLGVIRKRRGLSLRKLAERSGVHYVSLAKIEAGKLDPRLSTLRKLAQALGVTLSELAGELTIIHPSTKGGKYGTDKAKGRLVR
jgi:transcriptional regulator with XRE-family HTH domain